MLLHILGELAATKIIGDFDDPDAVQPNAIDLRLKEVCQLHRDDFVLDERGKTPRHRTIVGTDESNYYVLDPGVYEIRLGERIQIGPDEAGLVIVRSTLNRNGVMITTGLYDSGYEGSMLACLHVTTGRFVVEKNTRVAQFLVMKAESLHQYNGQYQSK